MNVLLTTALIALGSLVAGVLGSLTGLGGGIIIVPMLTLGFGVDLRYAIGASLVSVIATSSGAAAAYVRDGFTNIRVGMFLEVATTSGALLGAYLSALIPVNVIAVIFAIVLLATAAESLRPGAEHLAQTSSTLARRLRLGSTYPTAHGLQRYEVDHVPLAFGIMLGAGAVSALLGIGSGVVKVLAMDRAMHLPFKVSSTTSTFMIGVTAATSAGIYLSRGYIDPAVTFPVTLGVLAGALTGARMLARAPVRPLRLLFTAIVAIMAAEMLHKALAGRMS